MSKLTYEEAQEALVNAKEDAKELKGEFKTFKKENKIKGNKEIEDPKIKKSHDKLEAKVEKATAKVADLKEKVKELKPKADRQSKYTYPEGLDDKEKKKFRAKMRREAKAAEKGEEKPKKKDKKKKDKNKDEEED